MADVPGGTSSNVSLNSVSGTKAGSLEILGDTDWYKVDLVYGYGYQVWVSGSHFGYGTLRDPYVAMFSGSGSFLDYNNDFNHFIDGVVSDSLLYFAPNASGTYFVSVEEWGNNGTGTYQVEIARDELHDTRTAATLFNLLALQAHIGTGYDHEDWFRVELTAGVKYVIDVFGNDSTGALAGLYLDDPVLFLYDSFGFWYDEDDDSGAGHNSRLAVTPIFSGTYYVGVQNFDYDSFEYGSYQISVNPVGDLPILAVGSSSPQYTIDALGDRDYFAVTLQAGVSYEFRMDGGLAMSPWLEVLNTSYASLASTSYDVRPGDAATVFFTPQEPGTYIVSAAALGNLWTGSYTVEAAVARGSEAFLEAQGDGDFSVGTLRVSADFAKAAYASDDTWVALQDSGWVPVTFDFGDGSEEMVGGFYTNGPAAALVARYGDTLVISFRGTDPNLVDGALDVGTYPWHYNLVRPLVAEIENYIADPINGVSQALVTGHSLGGAMALTFMQEHPSPIYSATTFAAASLDPFKQFDERVTLLSIDGDPIAYDGDDRGHMVRFDIGSGVHAMNLYRAIAHTVDADSWNWIFSKFHDLNPEVTLFADSSNGSYVVGGGGNVLTDPLLDDYDIYYGGIGNDRLTGGGDPETLLGGPGNDTLHGGDDDDTLVGGDGVDTIDGGDGFDIAVYWSYNAVQNLSSVTVTGGTTFVADSGGYDELENVERIVFSDFGVAFDADGSAGFAATLIGAVFGAELASNPNYLGIAIGLLDREEYSRPELAQLALDLKLGSGSSKAAVISLVYSNLFGHAPDATTLAALSAFFILTPPSGVAMLAATRPENLQNIDFVGLQENGIVYNPWL